MAEKRVPTTAKVQEILEAAIGSEDFGNIVLPANDASVNVLHDLGIVPVAVLVTPDHNIGVNNTVARAGLARSGITLSGLIQVVALSIGNFWVANIDDTSFDINISILLGFDVKVFWLARG